MKTTRCFLFFIALGFAVTFRAQLSFTLSPTLCEGQTTTVTANPGTLTALAYSWAASPSGPVFSSSSTQSTAITFTAAGTYSIGVGILTPSGFAYTLNVIVINPSPTVNISASSSSVCSGQSTTLIASGASSYTWAPGASLNTTSGSSVIATPAISTVYSVTGSSGGCTATAVLPIIVYPSPVNFTIIPTTLSVCNGFSSTLTASSASSYTWTGTGISTPINQPSIAVGAGSYSVSATAGNCVYSSSITIGVAAPLNVISSASQTLTCIVSNMPKFSKSVNLIASGASSYTWSSSTSTIVSVGAQITVKPDAATCYTVIGATPTCSASAVSCISVAPQFSINISPASSAICLGEAVTLSITPSASTYSWTEPSTSSLSLNSYLSQTVSATPNANITYTAEAMDAQQCVSFPALATVTVGACTGLRGTALEDEVMIYPNPAKTQLKIRSSQQGHVKLQIMDVLGKTVLESSIDFDGQQEQAIGLEEVPAGIYLLKITGASDGPSIQRLIKE